MSGQDIQGTIKRHLHRVAPEADLDKLNPDDDLGRALDLDSMDFYTIMVQISEELSIDIPEEEYGNLRSLHSISRFITHAINQKSDV